MRQSLHNRLIGLVLCLLPTLLSAQQNTAPVVHPNERDYIIELLIFTQQPGTGVTEQPGPPPVLEPVTTPAIRLGETPAWDQLAWLPLQDYQPVEKRLTREATAISNSDQYRLLFHEAWRMHITGEDRSLPLLLEGGEYYSGIPELQGQIRLSVARYLHLQTDLYLHSFEEIEPTDARWNFNPLALDLLSQPLQTDSFSLGSQLPVPSAGPFYQIKASAPMQQRRRMRSNELHFLDTPYFGLLIRIERAEPLPQSQ